MKAIVGRQPLDADPIVPNDSKAARKAIRAVCQAICTAQPTAVAPPALVEDMVFSPEIKTQILNMWDEDSDDEQAPPPPPPQQQQQQQDGQGSGHALHNSRLNLAPTFDLAAGAPPNLAVVADTAATAQVNNPQTCTCANHGNCTSVWHQCALYQTPSPPCYTICQCPTCLRQCTYTPMPSPNTMPTGFPCSPTPQAGQSQAPAPALGDASAAAAKVAALEAELAQARAAALVNPTGAGGSNDERDPNMPGGPGGQEHMEVSSPMTPQRPQMPLAPALHFAAKSHVAPAASPLPYTADCRHLCYLAAPQLTQPNVNPTLPGPHRGLSTSTAALPHGRRPPKVA